MLIIDNVIVQDNSLSQKYFCCDLSKCKGSCCVLGDAGAPLEIHEIEIIQNNLNHIKPYMQNKAAELIDENNFFDYDADGNLVTTLLNNKECIFTNFNNGIAYCSIERAFENKKISFRKPISCFLYPIRIEKKQNFYQLFYHRWDICKDAIIYGQQKNIKLIDFLKVPLIERFGKKWFKLFYAQLNQK